MVNLQIIGLVFDLIGIVRMSQGLLLDDKTIDKMTTVNIAADYNVFGSALRKIKELERELKRNRKLARQGLIIIGFGFLLQITGLMTTG